MAGFLLRGITLGIIVLVLKRTLPAPPAWSTHAALCMPTSQQHKDSSGSAVIAKRNDPSIPRRPALAGAGSAMLWLVQQPAAASGEVIVEFVPNLFGPPQVKAVGWLSEAIKSFASLATTFTGVAGLAVAAGAERQLSSDIRRRMAKVDDIQDKLNIVIENSEMDLESKLRITRRKASAALRVLGEKESPILWFSNTVNFTVFSGWPDLLQLWHQQVHDGIGLVDKYVKVLLDAKSELNGVWSELLPFEDGAAKLNVATRIARIRGYIEQLQKQRKQFIYLAEECDMATWEASLADSTVSSMIPKLRPLLETIVIQVAAQGRPAGLPGLGNAKATFGKDGAVHCEEASPFLGSDGFCYKCKMPYDSEFLLGYYPIKEECYNCATEETIGNTTTRKFSRFNCGSNCSTAPC